MASIPSINKLPWDVHQVETVTIVGRTKKRSCEGKQKLFTLKFALKICEEINLRDNDNLEVYLCPFCNYFHLGHGLERKTL